MMAIGVGLMIVLMVAMFAVGGNYSHREGSYKEPERQVIQQAPDNPQPPKAPPKFFPVAEKGKDPGP